MYAMNASLLSRAFSCRLHFVSAAVCRGGFASETASCQLRGPLMPAGLSFTAWHANPGAHSEDGEIEKVFISI